MEYCQVIARLPCLIYFLLNKHVYCCFMNWEFWFIEWNRLHFPYFWYRVIGREAAKVEVQVIRRHQYEVYHWFFLFFNWCRDGRIKVIGGNNIEGLLVSPKQLPFKYLEVWKFKSGDEFTSFCPFSLLVVSFCLMHS